MKTILPGLVLLTCMTGQSGADDAPKAKAPREALQIFGDLIGSWRGTGIPVGTKEEQQKGFWTENLAWEWKFKGQDAWLEVVIKDGKYFSAGELRYVPLTDDFELKLKAANKETHAYVGQFGKEVGKEKVLTLERKDKKETHRLVFSLLHHNRFLYRYEVKAAGKTFYSKKYTVGATKEGESFATGDGQPECIVSGGRGTIAVSYQGQTYHVCCSGCRTEFNENPEKYIKEFKAKKAKKK